MRWGFAPRCINGFEASVGLDSFFETSVWEHGLVGITKNNGAFGNETSSTRNRK
jgi:hypothetical protein